MKPEAALDVIDGVIRNYARLGRVAKVVIRHNKRDLCVRAVLHIQPADPGKWRELFGSGFSSAQALDFLARQLEDHDYA